MDRIQKALVGCALGLIGMAVQAEPMCDCSKIVGRCAASIKMKSLTGAAPSYSANFSITSTTATCSKVSYYIDGTPYFNVLANTNTVEDSAFGTSPISMKNFSDVKCEVCAVAGQPSAAPVKQPPAAPAIDPSVARFVGSWSGTLRWTLATDPVTITVLSSGGRLTGSYAGKSGSTPFTSARISGNTLTFSFIGVDGGTYTYDMDLQGERSAKVSGRGLISFTGVVSKAQ
ncbi:hypothetical protein FXN65_10635 [Metapseudomonas lalkuanensis]|uniref:Uncharacterized protein n=1 Tax=Metapseudomonas lalkuanensis TaxID=2604832 RepID=A0A5J6QIU6_9GAMM|nr:hypothetical protein [Pseudomonas lalkuanensis]QEY62510.1 hypothetical protein FXN65_10635 [Pseudomonas lalkuanensis]